MTQHEFEKIWHDDNDYVVCHTSGSTGSPKEIRLLKSFMKESASRTNDFFGITDASRLHTCLDFEYIASKMMTVRADVAGCHLTSEKPSSRPLSEIGIDERIDLLSVVPAQMEWILNHEGEWTNIRKILIGGAPIPPLMRRLIAMSGYDAWESYGMTETASHIALRKVTDDDAPFYPLDGFTVRLNDSGCLVIDFPGGERFETHDLAKIENNGFRILGRADNCIISGGIKIMPEDLEQKLEEFIAFEYYISSVPDKKWGEKLVLVLQRENSVIEDELLKDAVGVRLRQFRKILDLGVRSPKDVVVVEKFPHTPNGKLDRKALSDMLRNL